MVERAHGFRLNMSLGGPGRSSTFFGQDNMTVTFGPGSAGGTLTLVNGDYVYLPATGFTGLELFSFTATDPHGGVTSGTLRFDVSQP